MLTLRQQSVTVDREELIRALEKSMLEHEASYAQALEDYQVAVKQFMKDACDRAHAGDFSNLVLKLDAPVNHSEDYLEIIGMMRVSKDQAITLDKESYNAYFRNQWPWTRNFDLSAIAYKSALGGLAGLK